MWQSVYGFISSTEVNADIWFNGVYLYHNLWFNPFRILNFSWKADLYNSIQIIKIINIQYIHILYDYYLRRNWYVNEKMIFEELKKTGNTSLILLSLSDLCNYLCKFCLDRCMQFFWSVYESISNQIDRQFSLSESCQNINTKSWNLISLVEMILEKKIV